MKFKKLLITCVCVKKPEELLIALKLIMGQIWQDEQAREDAAV